MHNPPQQSRVAVIGGGFTGLAAGYELARRAIPVTVIEKDEQMGGLAGRLGIVGYLSLI